MKPPEHDPDLRAQFESRGFAIIANLVDPVTLAAAASTYDALVDAWQAAPPPTLTICPALHWEKPSVDANAALLHGSLLAAIQHLADTILQAPATVSARIFFKAAGAACTTAHQDSAYVTTPSVQRVNIWIPLEPVDPENGCLFYYSGSHTAGPQLHHLDPRDPGGNTLTIVDLPDTVPTAVPLQAGGAVIHHRDVIHGAFPNTSTRPRRGLVAACAATKPAKAEHIS